VILPFMQKTPGDNLIELFKALGRGWTPTT